MTDPIMPCPKCKKGGYQVRAEYQHPGETTSNGWRRVCHSCGHEGPLRESGEAATTAWNEQWTKGSMTPDPPGVTTQRSEPPANTLRADVDKLLADSLPVILAADAVLQENARLRERVMELEADAAWRDISTAPKDGTLILIGWSISLYAVPAVWRDGSENYWKRAGWYELDEDRLTGKPSENADVWMPVPMPGRKPPTAGRGGG